MLRSRPTTAAAANSGQASSSGEEEAGAGARAGASTGADATSTTASSTATAAAAAHQMSQRCVAQGRCSPSEDAFQIDGRRPTYRCDSSSSNSGTSTSTSNNGTSTSTNTSTNNAIATRPAAATTCPAFQLQRPLSMQPSPPVHMMGAWRYKAQAQK